MVIPPAIIAPPAYRKAYAGKHDAEHGRDAAEGRKEDSANARTVVTCVNVQGDEACLGQHKGGRRVDVQSANLIQPVWIKRNSAGSTTDWAPDIVM